MRTWLCYTKGQLMLERETPCKILKFDDGWWLSYYLYFLLYFHLTIFLLYLQFIQKYLLKENWILTSCFIIIRRRINNEWQRSRYWSRLGLSITNDISSDIKITKNEKQLSVITKTGKRVPYITLTTTKQYYASVL